MLGMLQKDSIYIEKADRSRKGPFKANVSAKEAILYEAHIDIHDGDTLIRVLPMAEGREERYLVVEAHFSQGLASIPPHWQLKLDKTTAIRPAPPVTNNTTVNIQQSTGIQVGDHNTQAFHTSIENLLQRIDGANATENEKAEAKGLLAKLLQHPLVVSLIGAGVTGLLS